MIPVYGFLEGDTIGLLVLADENEPLSALAEKLWRSAAVRRPSPASVQVEIRSALVPLELTVSAAGLTALDRFDVRYHRPARPRGES